jgi:NADH dehydrogenase
MTTPTTRYVHAKNGTLIIGGGFGGAHVARLLGRAGATIVNSGTSMLYTPLLPEVAGGAIEPRHAIVPLRRMCPHAEIVSGRAIACDSGRRRVTVQTATGTVEIGYTRLVVALGSTSRMLPIPGLAETAMTFKSLGDAIRLRNHVLEQIERAAADPARAQRHLTFVFVGGGYAGVEALAETRQLVRDTLRRHHPHLAARLAEIEPRWVLVDGASHILSEVPGRLGADATKRLVRDGVDIRSQTRLDSVEPGAVALSDGSRIATETLVWAAGVVPVPIVHELGLPLDERGRIVVGPTMQVDGRSDVWALGDCAAVPNAATPDRTDPPTCQHALRQARRLVKSLKGDEHPYRYRSIGQGATLGRMKGIAYVCGLSLHGLLGSVVVRWYHMAQVPQLSRALRIMLDCTLSVMFGRDGVAVPADQDGGASAYSRIQACIAMPAATPALTERVEPYCAIEHTS